jgi:hypothetical protein
LIIYYQPYGKTASIQRQRLLALAWDERQKLGAGVALSAASSGISLVFPKVTIALFFGYLHSPKYSLFIAARLLSILFEAVGFMLDLAVGPKMPFIEAAVETSSDHLVESPPALVAAITDPDFAASLASWATVAFI